MKIIIFIFILGVVAGYTQSSKNSFASDNKISEEPILLRLRNNTVSSTESNSLSSISLNEQPQPQQPQQSSSTLSPILPSIEESSSATNTIITEKPEKEEIIETSITTTEEPLQIIPTENGFKRRVVTYDQRQEGQYNIRADLDNFMIVLIPPSPADGLNLLDMLSKFNTRRSPLKTKRKHYNSNNLKYNQNLRNANHNFNYLPRQQPPLTLVESVAVQRLPSEFIEGRTPYHVDISANDDEQSRIHPDRQVDVLPPPYPLAYQHLIKPFHLDAEPAVIQALPPSELSNSQQQASNNFLDSYNQLLASASRIDNENTNSQNAGYYRMSKSIRSDNLLDNNRFITANNFLNNPEETGISYYPPIDLPQFMLIKRKTSRSTDDNEHIDELEIDPEASLILADIKNGIERCAPGRRRDSYGFCREIEDY